MLDSSGFAAVENCLRGIYSTLPNRGLDCLGASLGVDGVGGKIKGGVGGLDYRLASGKPASALGITMAGRSQLREWSLKRGSLF
jgi:hypothetical protein